MPIPKFKVGDKVWTIKNGKAVEQIVSAVSVAHSSRFHLEKKPQYSVRYDLGERTYHSDGIFIDEAEVAISKEELIASL